MLSWVRNLLSNWIARVFFGLLVVVFVFWGVQNVFTMVSSDSAVAHVGGTPVDIAAVQTKYQYLMMREGQSGNGPPPDAARREAIAQEALQSVVEQQELSAAERHLGVAVPDAVVSARLATIPAFQSNGVFDKTVFDNVLANNSSTPAAFLSDLHDALADQQVLSPLQSGVAAPAALAGQLYDYIAEQRQAEVAVFAWNAQKAPAAPTDAVLQHYWRNHQAQFSTPEYRTAKIVVLSPVLMADQEKVTDAQVQNTYSRIASSVTAVPERSVQVITVPDAATAAKVMQAWNKGDGDWTKIQAFATKLGGTPIALDKASAAQIPSPDLAKAVFAAPPQVVSGPVPGLLGLYVFKVTAVTSSGPDQATVMAQIRHQIQLNEAESDIAQDADNLQDALAGQTPLDQLPGNLGLVAVEGTVDAGGHTPEGGVAPIPGGDDMRAAIVKAIFSTPVNTPAQMLTGPGQSDFAVQVEQISPPAVQSYAQAHDAVLAAWTQDQLERQAQAKAAAMLQAVNSGQNFEVQAEAAGVKMAQTPVVSRNQPSAQADSSAGFWVPLLFSMTPGKATMVQNHGGVVVALLTSVAHPAPADNQPLYNEVQTDLTKAIRDDIGTELLNGLQQRLKVSINQKLFAQIYQ
jgi:peptidyl-prolyl cis-trans isomerase D